jgi:hypothetical protein
LVKSTLPLFVARVFANDAHDVFAFHDAAGFAKALNGCSYFHDIGRVKINPFGGQKIALKAVALQCDYSGGLLLPEWNPASGQVVRVVF